MMLVPKRVAEDSPSLHASTSPDRSPLFGALGMDHVLDQPHLGMDHALDQPRLLNSGDSPRQFLLMTL